MYVEQLRQCTAIIVCGVTLNLIE